MTASTKSQRITKETKINAPVYESVTIISKHTHVDGVGHAVQLDLKCGNPQICCYLVWTIGNYKNGHPMFCLRAVTTNMPKAKLYSKMLRRDKEYNGETWYRIHIEARVANHLYAESMSEMTEAINRLTPNK